MRAEALLRLGRAGEARRELARFLDEAPPDHGGRAGRRPQRDLVDADRSALECRLDAAAAAHAPSRLAATGPATGARPTAERSIEFPDGTAEIRIGRRPDLELPLPYRALSALHARLVRADGRGWQIEDLGSTNGTRLDGERLTAERSRAV